MRDPSNDRIRIEHILQTIDTIIERKGLYSLETILADPIVFYGFVKHVEIIGEAVYMLSNDFRVAHTEVNWNVIEKMRHVLVHGYYTIKPEQLWMTVEQDIPALKPFIEKYKKELEENK